MLSRQCRIEKIRAVLLKKPDGTSYAVTKLLTGPSPRHEAALRSGAASLSGGGAERGELNRPLSAERNRNQAENSEGAINQSPPERETANRAKNERIGDYERASDAAKGEKP